MSFKWSVAGVYSLVLVNSSLKLDVMMNYMYNILSLLPYFVIHVHVMNAELCYV